jgi:DNA modification methylase
VNPRYEFGQAQLFEADCLEWLPARAEGTIHGVVTDPPYSLVEYTSKEQSKLRSGRGGVWRIPPSFDGHRRSPLPRFTTLTPAQLEALQRFFQTWASVLLPVLVPGAHVAVASNPLLCDIVSTAVVSAGFERRGMIVRLVMTMRGGDRPKNAHQEFPGVSVMPRSMWEPWLLFRRPLEGRVQDNLRKWRTGGLRRISDNQPFGDIIRSQPTRGNERAIAPHPSLKPQDFMRRLVWSILPLGEGVVLDPFAGSGSTLAAACSLGYDSIGVESDPQFVALAERAIPELARLRTPFAPTEASKLEHQDLAAEIDALRGTEVLEPVEQLRVLLDDP